VGVSLGMDRVDLAYYAVVEPLVDLRFLDGKLGFGLGVPLHVEVVDFARGADGQPVLFARAGRLRTDDWRSLHDFGRVLKYLTYGRKEDALYVNAGQRYASSIGHGALQRRYAPNLDIHYPRASAEVDAYNEYAGFELFTNDVLEFNQLAGLAFVKPLAPFVKDNAVLRSLSIGVSAALDWKAPWKLELDSITGQRVLGGDGRLRSSARAATLFGIDAELKVVKTAQIDLKPYVDYSFLAGGDGGLTVGVLGRFNAGRHPVHAFRVVAELRALGSRYAPSWFDTFYEVERFMYRAPPVGTPGSGGAGAVTKLDAVLTDGLGQRVGYYAEASWGIPGKVGLTLAFEGTSTAPEKNLVAHLELPLFDFVQLFASYYKRGLTDFAGLAALDEKTVVYAGARLMLLPILYINGRFYKTFRMDADLLRYDNQVGFAVDVELGYEFGHRREAPPPKLEDVPPAAPPEAPKAR